MKIFPKTLQDLDRDEFYLLYEGRDFDGSLVKDAVSEEGEYFESAFLPNRTTRTQFDRSIVTRKPAESYTVEDPWELYTVRLLKEEDDNQIIDYDGPVYDLVIHSAEFEYWNTYYWGWKDRVGEPSTDPLQDYCGVSEFFKKNYGVSATRELPDGAGGMKTVPYDSELPGGSFDADTIDDWGSLVSPGDLNDDDESSEDNEDSPSDDNSDQNNQGSSGGSSGNNDDNGSSTEEKNPSGGGDAGAGNNSTAGGSASEEENFGSEESSESEQTPSQALSQAIENLSQDLPNDISEAKEFIASTLASVSEALDSILQNAQGREFRAARSSKQQARKARKLVRLTKKAQRLVTKSQVKFSRINSYKALSKEWGRAGGKLSKQLRRVLRLAS